MQTVDTIEIVGLSKAVRNVESESKTVLIEILGCQ